MAISEETRHQLFQRLEQVLGPEEATTLMEHLPPVGWADVATKRDVDALGVATKRDIDAVAVATERAIHDVKDEIHELAVSTQRDIADVKHEIHELAVSTQRDIADVKHEIHEGSVAAKRDTTDLGQALRLEMAALETKIGSRLERELRMMTWRLITAGIAFGSLLVAAIRL